MKILVILLSVSLMLGCSSSVRRSYVEWQYQQPESFPIVTAIGYAQISKQHGQNKTEKMLNAMKASKLDAYRELAEQVHGQQLSSTTSVSDLVINNDSLEASVRGVIRGAKVVKSYPIGDTYATELHLDMQEVYLIFAASNPTRKIKNVTYY